MKYQRPPKWGELVGHADDDVIAFAVLWVNLVWTAAFYHAQQAIEKYLKALILSMADPEGKTTLPRKYWNHKLLELAEECAKTFPYYAEPATKKKLRFFAELDQALRYPWVKRCETRSSLSVEALRWFEELVHHLRNDIPIGLDDYMLAMLVRGYFHRNPSREFPQPKEMLALFTPSVDALRATFSDLNGLVRWP
jgi:HEPN domain-containing protein